MNRLVEIKSGSLMAVSVIVQSLDYDVIRRSLRDLTNGERDFFDNEIAIIDVSNVSDVGEANWSEIGSAFADSGLVLIGARNVSDYAKEAVKKAGLVLLEANVKDLHVSPLASTQVQSQPQAPSPVSSRMAPMIITAPVRAGQRVYAQGADLIITATVNNGAEVIADGNIHIYGALRGRALAGASGDQSSRIFAQVMEPELVSIAGVYRTFDGGYPANLHGHSSQVRLDGDVLSLEPFQSI